MAKDSKGRKFERIQPHTRVVNGNIINVRGYIRSTRSICSK